MILISMICLIVSLCSRTDRYNFYDRSSLFQYNTYSTSCVSPIVDLRAVFLFFFLHALGAKTWKVQKSFQQVLHGWVPWSIVAVHVKPEVRKLIKTFNSNM